MMRIDCPCCGPRDHLEFAYGGDGAIKYPPLEASMREWHDAVFLRENICGVQTETWQHVHGCRMWLRVERNTLTHEIHNVSPAHPAVKAALEAGH